VKQLNARGHFSWSTWVITGVGARAQMSEALRRFARLASEGSQGQEGYRSPHEIAAE
jgi:hypothetical protein